jgi:F-type H+-transporting ATPase subunit b
MSIDWITVLAQAANFLLLVWLLRRFLYRPILDGIDRREAEITRRMTEAETVREQARSAEARFVAQYEQSVAEQDSMVARALAATEGARDQLMDAARDQLEQERREWHRHLERERRQFMAHLQQAGALVLSELARRALRDLADETLEAGIARHIGRRLEPMAAELAAAAGANRQASVTSREALAEPLQARLRTDLDALLPGIRVQFSHDAEQSPGIVLQLGGARVEWTIDSYMDEFERLFAQDPAARTVLLPGDHEH